MPSGLPISRLRASARRTSDNGSGGWPTPDAEAHNTHDTKWVERREKQRARKINGNGFGLTLGMAAQTAGWQSPTTGDAKGRKYQRDRRDPEKPRLSKEGLSAGWPSPMAGTPAQKGNNEAGNNDSSRKTVDLIVGWPTPDTGEGPHGPRGVSTKNVHQSARDLQAAARIAGWATPRSVESGHTKGNPSRAENHRSRLEDQVYLSGWATPAERDHRHPNAKSYADRGGGKKGEQLPNQAAHSGPTPSSSVAPTEKRGALHPAFSLWLMGYPSQWMALAPSRASARSAARATPSSRKSPRRSSAK